MNTKNDNHLPLETCLEIKEMMLSNDFSREVFNKIYEKMGNPVLPINDLLLILSEVCEPHFANIKDKLKEDNDEVNLVNIIYVFQCILTYFYAVESILKAMHIKCNEKNNSIIIPDQKTVDKYGSNYDIKK